MKKENADIKISKIDAQSKRLFCGGKFQWEKSEADIWNQIETAIVKNPVVVKRRNFIRPLTMSFAAGIAILIGMTGFMRFYSKIINTEAGQHLLVTLPDKSTIDLNAESRVEFRPYWWRFDRSVKFEGEAFFNVEKGKRFDVISRKATVSVLGTSFNVFTREEVYRVTCITGSIRVTSHSRDEAVLSPGSKALVQPDGKIDILKNIETLPEISWKNNLFLFTASPVKEVFKEIERQYGVTILTEIDNYVLYTGNFTKDQNVEEILGYICPALGYKYIRESGKVYHILPNDE